MEESLKPRVIKSSTKFECLIKDIALDEYLDLFCYIDELVTTGGAETNSYEFGEKWKGLYSCDDVERFRLFIERKQLPSGFINVHYNNPRVELKMHYYLPKWEDPPNYSAEINIYTLDARTISGLFNTIVFGEEFAIPKRHKSS